MHLTIPGPVRAALSLLLLLGLGSCPGGSSTPASPTPGSGSGSATDAATPGGEGTICALGEHQLQQEGQPLPEAHPCAPGLLCCYPCGMQGCNSVCMVDCGPPRP